MHVFMSRVRKCYWPLPILSNCRRKRNDNWDDGGGKAMKPSPILRRGADSPDQLPATLSRRHFLRALSVATIAQLFPPKLIGSDAPPKPIFSDVTAEAGITWRQFNG